VGPNLLVVGSVALDSLEGGRVQDELGGSALYFALAASLIGPVTLVAPVGPDAERAVRERIAHRDLIDGSGLELVNAPTYRWFAAARAGRNLDLGSRDSIYDAWIPRPPAGYRGWAFVGSMRPDRQRQAAAALTGCGFLAGDAMRSYVDGNPGGARALLEQCHWYFANEQELGALGGGPPQAFRRRWGLKGLVVKRGPDGATVYTDSGEYHEPAVLLDTPAHETTGAGDCLAGAMLARWIELGGGQETMPEALRWGVAAATIAISDVGQRALVRATRKDLETLVATLARPGRRRRRGGSPASSAGRA
jgi:sugar/nucleoside kinase (ribokinase family)